ncbi:histidine phosphatase superfamily [Hypoxylon sp. FL1284]|nr:histidine phosphatase superfamily [Hypoxylon sp. FL1284]
MATIHLFRHAESLHNVDPYFERTRDPSLSDRGIQQCRDFKLQCWDKRNDADFPFMKSVTHIVCSPLRRAIQSALEAFGPQAGQRRLIVLPELTEISRLPSAFGSSRDELVGEFGDALNVDYLPDDYGTVGRESPWAYELTKIHARVGAAREWLASLARDAGAGSHIVVMAHGQLNHFLADNYEGPKPPGYSAEWDGNLSYRSYLVDPEAGTLHETPESMAKRGAPLISPEDANWIKEFLHERVEKNTAKVRRLYDHNNKNVIGHSRQ